MGGGKNAAGVHGGFSLGCDGVAAYATIEWIEAIDTIEF